MPLLSRGLTASHLARAHRRLFSSARSLRVELAYQLFEPPAAAKDSSHRRDGRPIVFMHGLFGSKQNNRSISKVLARDLNRDIFIVYCHRNQDCVVTVARTS
ncbi:Valacyclovir hydrolase, partial [Rasamsonia emersonii CBS 393.64]